MSAIFGGSKSKQQSTSTSTSMSGNNAYDTLNSAYTPTINTGTSALSRVAALLGLGGDQAAATSGYNDYLKSTDYDYTNQQGLKAITGSRLASGNYGSGSTLKALMGFGQANQQKYFGDYLSRLLGISQQGQAAGGLLSDAGKYGTSSSNSQSTGSSSSSEGIAKTLGAAASMVAASDRRLKKDVVLLDTLEDGLGVYEWTYISGGCRHQGHMADEIEALRPWALGPTIDGYKTVDYAKV